MIAGGNNKKSLHSMSPDFLDHSLRSTFDRVNRRSRRICRKICKSQALYWTIIILVFLNTITLASEHHKQPPWLDTFQGQLPTPAL